MPKDRSGTKPLRPGVVSVVTLNYRSAAETVECLRNLSVLDWPTDLLEVICVDNASGDGSAERIRAELPQVRLVESPTNTGFAGGCNFGASHASGEFLALINNDARPDPGWIRAAVEVLRREPGIACVASKVLDWEGERIDYVDASMTFYGMGYKRYTGDVDTGEHDRARDVLFSTGSAMVLRTEVFREVGGFDERFFMFYEDVDLGWRLNLLGHRVRYVPDSLVYHKHHATIARYGAFRERYLLERNALFTLYKNLDNDNLTPLLAASLALAVRRGAAMGGVDTTALDLQRSQSGDDEQSIEIDKTGLASFYAIDQFVEELPSLERERRAVQQRRRRSDRELMPLFGNLLEPCYPIERYLTGFHSVVSAFGVDQLLSRQQRILVVTDDTLSAKMAGPAIRAFHIADRLAREHEVRLVSTSNCQLDSPDFDCRFVPYSRLRGEVAWCDVVIFQGFVLDRAPWLAKSSKVIVVNLYDPMHLEQLEMERGLSRTKRIANVNSTTRSLNEQILRGDFFLCASEKQRHFWLGQMAAVGRVNVDTYDEDSSLNSLLSICPFGLSSTPPRRTRGALKGVVPGIGSDDKVILWAGGVYDWFDPLTLVRAVDLLRQRRDDVRLYFLGMRHPNPQVPVMRMAERTIQLSDQLGMTDKYVFFNNSWVEYDDRQNYLLDSDIGVSTHFEHVETAFSFRTRMLDYLWAGLPIVATGGDSFGDLIEAEGLGTTVDYENVESLADALDQILRDDDFAARCRENIQRVRDRFTWESSLEPLARFCRSPRRAPDRVAGSIVSSVPELEIPLTYVPSLRSDLELARSYLRDGGMLELTRRASGRVARKLRERRQADGKSRQ